MGEKMSLKLYTFWRKEKDRGYQINVRFPSFGWWGILTIIAMLSNAQHLVQIASFIFLMQGLISINTVWS